MEDTKNEQAPNHVPDQVPDQVLAPLREKINHVDKEIVELLAKRRALSSEAISVKDESQSPLRDPKREQDLLIDRIRLGRENGLDSTFVTRVFHEVIEDSLKVQQDFLQKKLNGSASRRDSSLKVAFHGIDGSYSHLAGKLFLEKGTKTKESEGESTFEGFSTFSEVVKAVEKGGCDYGLLPIETTISGGMHEVYDLLLNSRVSIVGEEKFKISYCLVGQPQQAISHLETIHCSALAVNECSTFLSSLPDCKLLFCDDSALAAKRARDSGSAAQAAIASDETAKILGLAVLKSNIANQTSSFTRYLLLAKTPEKVDARVPAKTSLVLSVLQKPGALVEALTIFKELELNLTKLESRPIAETPWEEMFYLDFEGNLDDEKTKSALQELRKHTKFLKVLGCYPRCDVQRTAVEVAPIRPEIEIPLSAESSSPKKPTSSGTGKSYKLTSRDYKSEDTVIDVQGVKIGGPEFLVISGPCSVESREQIMSCAKHAKETGSKILRGGVFKPRTSPYSFQGMGYEGLDLLYEAGKTYGMPIITEVMTEEDLVRVAEKSDIIQIGARNMQNFSLLKACGEIRRPIMLKRGMSASVEDLLQATEYILAGGNQQVFLCERGIRTFETSTRSTLDISAVPVLKERTHLPIFIDPSHAAGERDLVIPLALAAKAVGAHGIIVEFHPEPEKALSDGPQALRFPQLTKMMHDLDRVGQPL